MLPSHETYKQRFDVLRLIVQEADNNFVATHFAKDIEQPAYSSRQRLNVVCLSVSILTVNISAVDAIG